MAGQPKLKVVPPPSDLYEVQYKATVHSIVEVDGAVCMEQIVNYHPRGGARLVTTKWLDLAHRVLRQDQSVLVDEFPVIGGKF